MVIKKKSRTPALKKAQKKYDESRAKLPRLPGTRLTNPEEVNIYKTALKIYGGSGKDMIIAALLEYIKNNK